MYFYLNVPISKTCRLSELSNLTEIVGSHVSLKQNGMIVILFKETKNGIRLSVTHADFTLLQSELDSELEWVGSNCQCVLLKPYNFSDHFSRKHPCYKLQDRKRVRVQTLDRDEGSIFIELTRLKKYNQEIPLVVGKPSYDINQVSLLRHPKEYKFVALYPLQLLYQTIKKTYQKFTGVIFDSKNWAAISEEEYNIKSIAEKKSREVTERYDLTQFEVSIRILRESCKKSYLYDYYELLPREALLIAWCENFAEFDFVQCIEQTLKGLSQASLTDNEKRLLNEVSSCNNSLEKISDLVEKRKLLSAGKLSVIGSCVTIQNFHMNYLSRAHLGRLVSEKINSLIRRIQDLLRDHQVETAYPLLKEIYSVASCYLDKPLYRRCLQPIYEYIEQERNNGIKAFGQKDFLTAKMHFYHSKMLSLIVYTHSDTELGDAYHNYGASNHEIWSVTYELSSLEEAYHSLKEAKSIRTFCKDENLPKSLRRLQIIESSFIKNSLTHMKQLYHNGLFQDAKKYFTRLLGLIASLFDDFAPEDMIQQQIDITYALGVHCHELWKIYNSEEVGIHLEIYFKMAKFFLMQMNNNPDLLQQVQAELRFFEDELYVRQHIAEVFTKKNLESKFYHPATFFSSRTESLPEIAPSAFDFSPN